MNWPSDLHHQYALDRQQRLLGEAEAARLVRAAPARTRFRQLLTRSTGRPEAAPPCPPVGAPLTDRA